MKKNKIIMMLVLLCAVVQGAWADGGWELVYRQTNTTSATWTALNAGSSTGYTIGTAGTTTYYYATGNLSFTNSTVGGSGLTIRGTVYLYIPSGKTVRCTGAKANDTGITGGGAGVELAAGNTLYLLGDGRLEATGGDGESGNHGDHGEDANFEYNKYCQPGSGGRGGDGGGGGGAGIGTRGGNGGAGGAGGSAKRDANEGTNKGVAGSPGSNGDTAGSMGTLYVYQGWNLSVVAKGGGAGWFTSARSNRGKNAAEDPGNQYAASGGGGGGTSGNGSAGSDIGTGGGGGGGGGGGAAGNSTWRYSASNGFYRVGAGGGKGGEQRDGDYASDGESSELSNPYDAELNHGLVGTYDDDGWENDNGAAAGGSGGTCGAASKSGAAVTINVVLDDIFRGEGTESAPYIIGSIADWDVFALLVSNGISFNGLFVKLTSDISVSTMVGISETNSFQGTFLGDNKTLTFTKGSAQGAFAEEYCAPFRYVKNAVIRNLRVTGDIYTARKFAAGLVARSYGETTFTDCHVSTVIHSSKNGDGTHGGFVAYPDGNVTITGSVFAGRLLTNNGTNSCGGFVGLHNGKTFNFTHSLYAPDTTAPADGETTITAGCATFVRGGSPANGSTCYYTETMGTEQGSKVIVLASAPSNFGSMVQDYGTVKVYDNGLLVAGRYYVACDIAGTGTEGDPYTIGSTGDWNTLASYVGYGHTFSGQFVKLGGDISVETMVGTGDTNSFQGTFDGGSHTLTFTKGTAQNVFDEDHCAPFRHVKNAVIKNLHVAGTIYTSAKKAAGIVGESHGALTLTGCCSSIAINSSINGDGTHGGLVSTLSGENNTIIIEGCVFDGSFATTNGTNNCGGFIGWGVYNKPTKVYVLPLCQPTKPPHLVEPVVLPTDQGTKAVYSARWSTGNLVQDYGMLKAYQNGILYGDIYYADADKASGGAGSGTEGDPYTIGSANEWNAFAIWGWNEDGASPMLQNCLEKGTYTNIGSMHPMGLQGGSGTISQPCYYLNPQIGSPTNACAVSGAYQAYTVNTVEGEMLRPLVLVDGNTYYTPCLIAADDYYHRTGNSVGVTPVVTASNGTPLTLGTDYTATLNGEAVAAFPIVITTLGPKNFTITGLGNCNGSKSISFIVYGFDGEGTEESPYIISNTDQWDAFASEVNLGNACSGKHVKLTADISVTTMVGYRVNDSDNKPFSGTFNGDGHTITATIRGNSNQGNAPFRYIDGATIRNLTIAGTIASNQHYSSGLVGFASGTNLIEGCIVTATLNIRNDSYVGGFVGHGLSSTTTIRNCIFAGGIYGIDSYLSHAGSFWGWSDNATPTLENCVEMGYYNDRGVFGMHPMGLLGGNGTLSNCYYKNTPTRNPTNAWTITPNSDYGRIYTEPSATEIRKSITINGTTVYSDNCAVSGVTLTYLTNDAITPVVTEPYNSIALTLGTNYTVTLDGEPVESFPLTLTTSGSRTLVVSGIGSYVGAKSFTIVVSDSIEGDGTHDNPYLISNDENWILFTSYVNSGTTYSGKYVKLMADINVSDMVGTSESKSFQGTFLGNGHTLTFSRGSSQNYFDEDDCAPFRYVKNATIQDLKVTGAIYTSQMSAGGLVAESFGTTNINNCQVGIFIRTYNYLRPDHGGIVAEATGTLNITGCVFNGRLLNTRSGVIRCGGIIGYTSSSATVKISNTLYAPAPASGENVINAGSTFVETIYDNTFTLTNCYHTETMGKTQGTQAYTISGGTGVTVSNAGTVRNEYSVSGLTFYTTGIKYNDVLYGGNGSNVSLTLTNNRPGYFARYAASAGTLTDTGNPYTLTMPDENVTISVAEWVEITFPGSGTAGDPYTISNRDEWTNFAYNVNSGNNFSGKYVRLDADIAITNMCGTVSGYTPEHAFSGTFLGDGHTITAALADDGNQGLAPFRYINGATIKDLKVAGTIASSQYHTSGLVGFANGTNTIEDCLVTATLNITSNYAGGIIGHGLNSNTTIRGCAFAGTINGVDVERENIGGIWGWSSSGTPTLLNCLENGTYTNIASMHPMGLQGATGTITNCYYLNAQTGSPRNVCTVSGAKQAYTAATTPANLGNLVQDYGIVKAYANGILFDSKYYAAPATISLANAADNSTTISNANGYVANVTLTGRTLYKDGAWNTLCLPFNVNNFTGTPLDGATVMELGNSGGCKTGFDSATGTLTLDFVNANMIEAGHAYIVMWTKPSGYDGHESDFDIRNPVFNGVTVVNENPAVQKVVSQDGYVQFIGTYSPVDIYTDEKTNLYLGADNTLYYPWGDAMASFNINSFRAYFQLLNGLTAGDPVNGVRAINLNFGEGSEETIISPAKIAERADAWYTIDGVKLNGKPNVKGKL